MDMKKWLITATKYRQFNRMHTTAETGLHGTRCDQFDLAGRFGIELKDSTRTMRQRAVQRRKESQQSTSRVVCLVVSVAQPLQAGDASFWCDRQKTVLLQLGNKINCN
jgi:hypothetical protein